MPSPPPFPSFLRMETVVWVSRPSVSPVMWPFFYFFSPKTKERGRSKLLQLDQMLNHKNHLLHRHQAFKLWNICFKYISYQSHDNFFLFRNLQELYSSGNRISELSFVPEFFPRLEVFNISCNNIKTLDEVVCIFYFFSELYIKLK
jgi:Leucine-rich repeat (LRR) protein